MRKQWYRTTPPVVETPRVALRFKAGQLVKARDTGDVGMVIDARQQDGRCCVVWLTGSREWLSQDGLSLVRVHMSQA
jgi:hypothetical protein